MNKHTIALVICLAAASTAQAQNQPQANPVRVMLGMGLTAGGDKLATTAYTDGTSVNIKAGSGGQFYAGADYRINESFSVQGNIGVHVHFTPEASNGDASFKRVPVELIGYFHIAPQWRLGAGARFISNAKLSGSGFASGLDYKFKNTTGAVLEAEYLWTPHVGFKLRGVSEEYTVERNNAKLSGSHIGVALNYYF